MIENRKMQLMKQNKILSVLLAIALMLSFGGCSSKAEANSPAVKADEAGVEENVHQEELDTEEEQQLRVASDGAQMQTENPALPTRVIEGGTKINMHFGETVIPGILNDSETAKALIEKLPYTVHMNRYSHDFCGVMDEPLPYSEENVHYGWLNGDIDFATNADYFTILFEDEAHSEQYGYQVNIGVIDCELSEISSLQSSYDVLIELAE